MWFVRAEFCSNCDWESPGSNKWKKVNGIGQQGLHVTYGSFSVEDHTFLILGAE